MDTKQKYDALMKALADQLEKELPTAQEGEEWIIGKRLLLDSAAAAALFTSPPAPFETTILKELSAGAFRHARYCRALYSAAGEADLEDAVADLAYAQLQRKPVIRRPRPAGEFDRAACFVLAVYTAFAILQNGYAPDDFNRLFAGAWNNFYLNLGSRSIRQVYDRSWYGKYSLRSTFFPLG